MTVQLVVRAFALSSFVFLIPTATAAAEPEPRSSGEELRHLLSFGPRVAYHSLRERNATERGAPEDERLGGFAVSYERILVPEAWACVVSKPLLFNSERFDSPIDLQGKRMFAVGDWELFVGAGITANLRVFRSERRKEEARSKETTLGLLTTTGLTRRLGKRVTVAIEAGYAWIPLSRVVEHEFTGSVMTGYAF